MVNQNLQPGYGRALSYSRAIAEIFYLVLSGKLPLDRELKKYFRQQKECGSKDRAFISEALCSLFRWYGWLGQRLPKNKPENPLESKKFSRAVSAALWLDNHEPSDVTKIFFSAADVDAQLAGQSPLGIENKKKGLACFFKFTKLDMMSLVPTWFIEELPDYVESAEIIEALQTRPPVWLRLQNNPDESVLGELKECGLNPQRHHDVNRAVKLVRANTIDARFNVNDIKSYANGFFEVQDLASQCLGLVCNANQGQRWWDVCAGAGGKSLLVADQMGGRGKIVATDKREWILEEIQKRAKRGGFKNIQISSLDKVLSDENIFDGVLVDAPCSCTGTWRRNPDARWRAQKDICRKFSDVQKEILGFSSQKVKKGGVLVYTTCSLSIQENEQVVEFFLKKFSCFQLEDFLHPLGGEPTGGIMRVNFNPDDCDAMFAARFRRK